MVAGYVYATLQRPTQAVGHLFQGRYKAKVVDEDPEYFSTAGLYILLNPVDAGRIDLQNEALKEYRWSSYPSMIVAPSKRPEWLAAERLMSSFGIGTDSRAGRRAFAAYVHERGLSLQLKEMSKVDSKEWRLMERGWVHGCADFRTAMLKLLKEGGQTVSEASDQQRDIAQSAADKALDAGLESLNLDRDDLLSLKKGDERKLLLCGWLRNHFPVSTKWCCDTLCMGHTSTATRALHFYENPPRGWGKAKARLVKILDLFG